MSSQVNVEEDFEINIEELKKEIQRERYLRKKAEQALEFAKRQRDIYKKQRDDYKKKSDKYKKMFHDKFNDNK
jgi:hypothetical protein